MRRFHHFMLSLLGACLIALATTNVAFANPAAADASADKTIDSILGALADMTVDKAKAIISLRFAREFREKVCGYNKYNTAIKQSYRDDHKRFVFNASCDYVSHKVERNILSEELIEAFRKDMVTNGVLLIKTKDNIEVFFEKRKAIISQAGDFDAELLAINIINLSWVDTSTREIILQALSENEAYRYYTKYLRKMADVAAEINKIKRVIRGSIKVRFNAGNTLVLRYDVLPEESGQLETRTVSLNMKLPAIEKSKFDTEVASLLLAMANANDKETLKQYSRNLLIRLLNNNCNANCIKSVNNLIDNRPDGIYATLTSLLKLATSVKESEQDLDNVKFDEYKALGTLATLSELSNVSSKDSAKAILSKYEADENTRTARYWEHNWTLGTLLGAAGGKADCDGCEDRTLPPNLYMPFGLFYTRGWFGAQLHVFDLGQYTSDQDNATSDQSTKWEDAVAPGMAVFLRLRRFPLGAGIDYTYKPDNGGRTSSETQIRLFIAMDIHLFTLN